MIRRNDDDPGPLKRNSDFALLMAGESVNNLGTAVGVIALTLIIYNYSHSPVLVGVIDAVELVTLVLCGLPAGWVADRAPKAPVLAVSAVVGAVTYGALSVIVAAQHTNVAFLLVAVVVIGASSSVYNATSRAAVRRVVRVEDLAEATSLIQARGALTLIVGAPIGGVLYGWHDWFPLAFNAVSYLTAMLASLSIRRRMRIADDSDADETEGAAVLAGLRFLWASRPLRGVTVIGVVCSFASGGLLMSLIVSLQQRHYPYPVVGGVQSACAVGMVIGAVLSPVVLRRFTPGRHLPVALFYIAAFFTTVALAKPSWLILTALLLGCVPVVPMVSALTAYEASVVPARLQGRVASADRALTDSAGAVAPLVGGVLLQYSGPAAALGTFAMSMALAGIYAYADRGVRTIPNMAPAMADPVPGRRDRTAR